MDPMIARLIAGEMANLRQLQTVYSLSDAIYLDEVLSLKEERIFLDKQGD